MDPDRQMLDTLSYPVLKDARNKFPALLEQNKPSHVLVRALHGKGARKERIRIGRGADPASGAFFDELVRRRLNELAEPPSPERLNEIMARLHAQVDALQKRGTQVIFFEVPELPQAEDRPLKAVHPRARAARVPRAPIPLDPHARMRRRTARPTPSTSRPIAPAGIARSCPNIWRPSRPARRRGRRSRSEVPLRCIELRIEDRGWAVRWQSCHPERQRRTSRPSGDAGSQSEASAWTGDPSAYLRVTVSILPRISAVRLLLALKSCRFKHTMRTSHPARLAVIGTAPTFGRSETPLRPVTRWGDKGNKTTGFDCTSADGPADRPNDRGKGPFFPGIPGDPSRRRAFRGSGFGRPHILSTG